MGRSVRLCWIEPIPSEKRNNKKRERGNMSYNSPGSLEMEARSRPDMDVHLEKELERKKKKKKERKKRF